MWGETKYINGVIFIPIIAVTKRGQVLPSDYINNVYVSDSRGLEDDVVNEKLEDVKGRFIGKQYSEWLA